MGQRSRPNQSIGIQAGYAEHHHDAQYFQGFPAKQNPPESVTLPCA
jgi:hypothetical protein